MADLTRRHLYHVITATRESVLEPLSGPPSIATTFSRKIKHLKDQKIMRDLGLEREEGDPEDHSLGPPLLGKKIPFHYDQIVKKYIIKGKNFKNILMALNQAFFNEKTVAEKTKTQAQNSSQNLKEKTQPQGGTFLLLRETQEKNLILPKNF